MANKNYTPESLKAFNDWSENIEASTKLRQTFPSVILTHKGSWVTNGYNIPCKECGTILKASFGDYSKPLDEKFVPCLIDKEGHGHWASVINVFEN